jgi:methyl-accepting chemotaxis protein
VLDNTNDDLGRSTVESRSSWKSLLTNRLLLALLTVSLVPLAFMGISTYRSASSALESQALNQLETVRTITAKSVQRYFVTLEDQLRVLSEDQMTIAAVKEFTSGMAAVASDDEMTAETVADARQQLIGFYEGDVAAAYRERGQEPPLARDLVDGLDEDAALLQHLYLASNKNPIGSKDRLDNPDDGSRYSQSHASYHPIFRSIQQKFGLYDLFLVDAESGDIVYSVFKETDFATSLRTGAFASSSIGSAFTEAVNRGRKDTVAFADFRPYLPSYSAPASFIASPIYDGRELVGTVIFQLPIDRLNEIISETVGMGDTGETYAVGPDGLFRTDSRFLSDLGVETTIINPEVRVDSRPVQEVFDHNSAGTARGFDYRGSRVLASWSPITVHPSSQGESEVRWALISEIDEAEVFGPINNLRNFALTIFIITTIGVVGVSTGIARRFTKEAERQATLVNGIVDNTHALASASEELTSVSQQMSAAAEETTAQANLVSAAAEQVSGSTKGVSSSVENLGQSIHEIAGSAQEAARVARQAVEMAGSTTQTMNALGMSSQQIGQVVKVITTIAEQTNLLALNATIEAARAGEAGKGFAVVANEVKDLARETAKATEDIGTRIEAMQADADRAVTAISEIGSVIERIDNLQTTIAAAVEEQSVTTAEISRNIGEATTGTAEIAENIVQVAQAAQSTSEGASNTQVSSQELSRMAQGLQKLVSEYRS